VELVRQLNLGLGKQLGHRVQLLNLGERARLLLLQVEGRLLRYTFFERSQGLDPYSLGLLQLECWLRSRILYADDRRRLLRRGGLRVKQLAHLGVKTSLAALRL